MTTAIRRVEIDHVAALLDMMQRAHTDAGFAFDREIAKAAFTTLLKDHQRGVAWIALRDLKPQGYIVLTFKLSMESGGFDAFIEDIFVYREARRKGVGSALMSEAMAECRRTGVCAIHVETGASDEAATNFYAACGLKNRERTILTSILRENPLARPI